MSKKIAAFFDIDGTIFRDSLMIAHFQKMREYGIINDYASLFRFPSM